MCLAGVLLVAVIGISSLPATPLPSDVQVKPRSERAQAKKKPRGNNGVPTRDSAEREYNFSDFNGHPFSFRCSVRPQENRELIDLEAFFLCAYPPNPSRLLTACYRPELKKVHFNVPAGSDEYASYMQRRGRRCNGQDWDLDYGAVVTEAREPLKDCRTKLAETIGSENSEALEAFLLSLPSADLGDIDSVLKKWTLGLRVPTSVMRQVSGDCDSKAALFCSLYSGTRNLVIFHSVPGTCISGDKDHLPRHENKDPSNEKGHAMAGIDADGQEPPFPDNFPDWWKHLESEEIRAGSYTGASAVVFGDRHFIPVEVNGSGEVELGKVLKDCRYEVIPIPALGKSFRPAPAIGECVKPVITSPESGLSMLRRR